jgi:uncharacterized membrane protein
MESTKTRYRWLVGLNLVAVLATIYLTYAHFKPSASEVCNFSEQWNCEIVNQSIYSEIFGIPVSILGFITYALLTAFALRGLKRSQAKLLPWVLAGTVGATGFALYLTGIETFVLKTYCIFCVVQQVIILLDLGLITSLTLHRKKP